MTLMATHTKDESKNQKKTMNKTIVRTSNHECMVFFVSVTVSTCALVIAKKRTRTCDVHLSIIKYRYAPHD